MRNETRRERQERWKERIEMEDLWTDRDFLMRILDELEDLSRKGSEPKWEGTFGGKKSGAKKLSTPEGQKVEDKEKWERVLELATRIRDCHQKAAYGCGASPDLERLVKMIQDLTKAEREKERRESKHPDDRLNEEISIL